MGTTTDFVVAPDRACGGGQFVVAGSGNRGSTICRDSEQARGLRWRTSETARREAPIGCCASGGRRSSVCGTVRSRHPSTRWGGATSQRRVPASKGSWRGTSSASCWRTAIALRQTRRHACGRPGQRRSRIDRDAARSRSVETTATGSAIRCQATKLLSVSIFGVSTDVFLISPLNSRASSSISSRAALACMAKATSANLLWSSPFTAILLTTSGVQ